MTCAPLSPMPQAARFRRDPAEVMRLARLGCSHPTRLSFLRILLRRMQAEDWRVDRPVWDMDARGVGRAVYRARGPERTYSLVAFAHDLPPEDRSDRVIATAWDATFALFDGDPSADDLDRLAANVPLQEAGRVTASELTLSRANRSVRLFAHVVDALANERQPDAGAIADSGYLMRTTAVYGSGKFGAASHAMIRNRPELAAPFQAEMLTVWLIRAFTVDLVDHLAAARNPSAHRLGPKQRRALGVGNSTGLGMAPFLVRHPILLNNWMMVREEALARVRALPDVKQRDLGVFRGALAMATVNARHWTSEHPVQIPRLNALRAGLDTLSGHVAEGWDRNAPAPWDALWRWAEEYLPLEAQEALLGLMLEPHGAVIDGLATCYSEDEDGSFALDGSMSVADLRDLLNTHYAWASETDYADAAGSARFWYVSEDKQEPRLGERAEEPGADRELPLDIGRQAAALVAALKAFDPTEPIARLLLERPDLRGIARRVQLSRNRPFAEIRDNLIAADMMPIDMLRAKLAVFGATRFDPRSDRWVRISLFQGAPYPGDLAGEQAL